jgi:hypothetical protein
MYIGPADNSEDELLEKLEMPAVQTKGDDQKTTATREEIVKKQAALAWSQVRGTMFN